MKQPYSAAAARNSQPIFRVLQQILPESGQGLEVASGTGQHVVYFASRLPGVVWQPSERDPQRLDGLRANIVASGLDNIQEPVALNVISDWPELTADAVYVANLLHISIPDALPGLMRGAANVLTPTGQLLVYGPFKQNGEHTSEGNVAFDRSLRAEHADWGIRDMESVSLAAQQHGLYLQEVFNMPANNFLLRFSRSRQD